MRLFDTETDHNMVYKYAQKSFLLNLKISQALKL